jgi:hypothetical protein
MDMCDHLHVPVVLTLMFKVLEGGIPPKQFALSREDIIPVKNRIAII